MKVTVVFTLLLVLAGAMMTRATKATRAQDCFCELSIMPVCGTDGKTYSNACMALCKGVAVYKPGSC